MFDADEDLQEVTMSEEQFEWKPADGKFLREANGKGRFTPPYAKQSLVILVVS